MTTTDNTSYAVARSFIAAELAKLSAEDRENIYYDMHRISAQVEETPAFLETSFRKLRDALRGIIGKSSSNTETTTTTTTPTKAYQLALSMDANYVQDPEFELRFLRCDRFDISKTAVRLIRHFWVKLDLFGPDKLLSHHSTR
jgi:hypothetical protein